MERVLTAADDDDGLKYIKISSCAHTMEEQRAERKKEKKVVAIENVLLFILYCATLTKARERLEKSQLRKRK
jgi:hypothetical protein